MCACVFIYKVTERQQSKGEEKEKAGGKEEWGGGKAEGVGGGGGAVGGGPLSASKKALPVPLWVRGGPAAEKRSCR